MDEHNKSILKDYILPLFKDILIPIIVGACSISVAMSANKIATQQALIAKNAELPVIRVSRFADQDYDSGLDGYQIGISISGERYDNYEAEIITFSVFDFYIEDDPWDQSGEVQLPLPNFYYAHTSQYIDNSDTFTYTERYWYDGNNYRTLIDLQDGCTVHYTQQQNEITTLTSSIVSYVKVSYTNLLDEEEVAYYLVDSYDSVKKVPKNEGDKVFNLFYRMFDDNLYIVPNLHSLSQVIYMLDTVRANRNWYTADIDA